MKKIMFLTGTRADYGKIKSLMKKITGHSQFRLYLFVTGMHMIPKYGSTWREIEKDGFKNVYHFINHDKLHNMDISLSNTIQGFSNYIHEVKPDLIVVHGDRLEALAGAIVGAFNNIRVVHIEGGEVSGTIDESIRHAITKFAHIHLVSNEESKKRIEQLGEDKNSIYIIGSPDIDIMLSQELPTIESTKDHYQIHFDNYAILIYHPVTTEQHLLKANIKEVVDTVIASQKNYIVIYPNNDSGSEIILKEYNRLRNLNNILIYPSIRFENFLTLLKNADFVIGNSSAGIRETVVYGIPAIDLGTRQNGRYHLPHKSILHTNENKQLIFKAIKTIEKSNSTCTTKDFGDGESDTKFLKFLEDGTFWNTSVQKKFFDLNK
ncbi:UDP-N-acetylglucosamine 2-epimerase [Lysinibacillus sp. M3]|uniref:UDP-N-acetylglucosamine 2-epimerase n=1 Tax=Lysinibacillus zambalensis TaxID=3160866 RepID=A0ABV1MWF3_9BACI